MSQLLPTQFHFIQPEWLWLLCGLPLIWLLVYFSQREGNFRQLADAALLPHLLTGKAKQRIWPIILATLVWVLAAFALAGPSWKKLPTPVAQQKAAQVIAVSLSNTLYADDVKPSRMARARFAVTDLLKANAAGLNGLIGFAGDAFVVAPLTRDSHSLSALLDAMSPRIMPVPGHDAAAAIKRSVNLLQRGGAPHGLIVLITDMANKAAIKAAAQASSQGIRVAVLGVGSDKRQPITLPRGKLLHDSEGNLVLSQRQDQRLRAIAEAGHGTYALVQNGQAAISQIESALQQGKRQATDKSLSHWQDAGPWLLLPLLLLLALGFRRGWLLVLVMTATPWLMPQPAQAADWQSLWLRPDQQAAQAIEQNQPALAEKLAESPQWKGSAAYKAGHFKAAVKAFQQSKSADAQYNLGNAYAQLKQYDKAIAAYEKALEKHPNNADAQYNLELVKKLKKKQQQQKKQNKKGQSKQNQKQNQRKKNNQKSSSKKRDGQKQDASQKTPKAGKQGQQQKPNQRKDSSKNQKQPAKQQPSQAKPKDKSASKTQQQQYKKQMDKALKQQKKAKQPDTPVNRLGAKPSSKPLDKLPDRAQRLLQAVPDDPGALLRRKFQLQYQQRQAGGS